MRKKSFVQRASALTMAIVLAGTNLNLDSYGPVFAEEAGELDYLPEDDVGGEADLIEDGLIDSDDPNDGFADDGNEGTGNGDTGSDLIEDPDLYTDGAEDGIVLAPEITSVYMKQIVSDDTEQSAEADERQTLDLSAWNFAQTANIDIAYEVQLSNAEDAFSDWDAQTWEEILIPVIDVNGSQQELFLSDEDTRVIFDDATSRITIQDLDLNTSLIDANITEVTFRLDPVYAEQRLILPENISDEMPQTETSPEEITTEETSTEETSTEEASSEETLTEATASDESITEEANESLYEAESEPEATAYFRTAAAPDANLGASGTEEAVARNYTVNQSTYNIVEADAALQYKVEVITEEGEAAEGVSFSGVRESSYDEETGTYTVSVDAGSGAFRIESEADVRVTPVHDANLVVTPDEAKELNAQTSEIDFAWRKTFTYTVNQTLKNIDSDDVIYMISTKVSNNAGQQGTEPVLTFTNGARLFNRDNPVTKDGRTTFSYCIKVPTDVTSFDITTTAGDIKIEPITVEVLTAPNDPMAGETLETGKQIYVSNIKNTDLTGSNDGNVATFVLSKIQNYTVHQNSELENGTIRYTATVTVPAEEADQQVDGSKISITRVSGEEVIEVSRNEISSKNEDGSSSYIYSFDIPAATNDFQITTTATAVDVEVHLDKSNVDDEDAEAYPSSVTVTMDDTEEEVDIRRVITYTVDQTTFNIDGSNTYEIQIAQEDLKTRPVVTVQDAQNMTESEAEDGTYIYRFQIPVEDTEFEIVTASSDIKVVPVAPDNVTVEEASADLSNENENTSASFVFDRALNAEEQTTLSKRWYDDGQTSERSGYEFGLKYSIGESGWTEVPTVTADAEETETENEKTEEEIAAGQAEKAATEEKRAAIREELHLTEDLALGEKNTSSDDSNTDFYYINGPISKNGQSISYQLTESWAGEGADPYLHVELENGSLANYLNSYGYTVNQTSYNILSDTANKYTVTIPRNKFEGGHKSFPSDRDRR